MIKPTYAYSGMVAATWDLLRKTTTQRDDRQFYLDILKEYGQPVLDVGCATGRLTLDYLAVGIDIDGVDLSAEMLSICRKKAEKMGLSPRLYQQDITALDLPRTYKTILVPSNTFQIFTDPGTARAVIRGFFRHLQPGGALAMPFSFQWRTGDPLDTGWYVLFERMRPEDGAIVRCQEHTWIEPDQQLWHAEQRFEVFLGGKVITHEEHRRSPEGRWYTQAQALELYAETGFSRTQLFHEFTRQPAAEDDTFFCAVGIR